MYNDRKDVFMKNKAIVVAAGSGSRMGGDIPKQFRELAGKPVICYCLETLEKSDLVDEVVVVVSESYMDYCKREIKDKYGFSKVKSIIPGGEYRSESSAAGLKACGDDTDLVLIHDAARPFLTGKLIADGFALAAEKGSAIAAVPCKDTIKIIDDREDTFAQNDSKFRRVVSTPERSTLMAVQTPQAFKYKIISSAYERMTYEGMMTITDDACAVEEMTVFDTWLYEGDPANIKLTTPEDLEFAEWKMSRK